MKERLINNLGLKILSVFLAFFIWLVVVNVSNPETRGTHEVPLDIINEQVLHGANRTYEVIGKNTVTIDYRVHARDAYKISAADFRAYIDLADLYDVTGSVPVKIEVLNNKSLINLAEPRQSVVRVETEELQRKPFELSVKREGNPINEYAFIGVKLEPDSLYLEGPESEIGRISHAGIEINIEGRSEDYTDVAEPIFYDSNNNIIPLGKNVVSDTPEVTYHVTISRVKKLPLDFEVSGTVAPGYKYVGAESTASTVSVIGLRNSLADVNKITIPASELNLDGAMADRVVTVDLKDYLPEGVQMIQSEPPVIEIRLKVERLVNKTFRLSEDDIIMKGASDAYAYRLIPAELEVTMQGLREDLDSLKPADLAATLNLVGMEPGRLSGILTFGAGDAFKVISYSDFEVETSRKEPGITATPVESQTSEELQSQEQSAAAEPTGPGETAETTEPSSVTEESGQTTAADG